MPWYATNVNQNCQTIGDSLTLPDWYVISDNGIVLERDDGEVRTFKTRDSANRAAALLDRGIDP